MSWFTLSDGGRVRYEVVGNGPSLVITPSCSGNAVGGWFANVVNAGGRFTPYIQAAWIGGMEAGAEVPYMRERIAANPRNRDLLLAWEPAAFIARMKEWARFYIGQMDEILTGMTADELRGLTMSTLIFEGGDETHPKELTDALHELIPGSAPIAPARWGTRDWWTYRTENQHFTIWRELVPEIIEFLESVETEAAAR